MTNLLGGAYLRAVKSKGKFILHHRQSSGIFPLELIFHNENKTIRILSASDRWDQRADRDSFREPLRVESNHPEAVGCSEEASETLYYSRLKRHKQARTSNDN